MSHPLVTAIVSTYCAERFMRGCLEDLLAQTLASEIEILVIDSGSLQGESAICEEFARQHPQIRVVRTEREPLYTAWNRAIPLARGKYITSANTDDRHRPDFMEVMASALDRHDDIALAYAEQFISHTENETFAECERRGARARRLPDYTPAELMLRCMTGSQPMWRKALHDELGYFDTRFRIAADYDMWLRFASRYCFQRVPGPMGVFFDSPDTISGANSVAQLNLETLAIQKACMCQNHWRAIPGMRKRLAAEWFGRGYQRIVHDRDNRAAEPFIREAIKLDPTNFGFFKTYVIRCIANIV